MSLAKAASAGSEEQEGDSDVETALAALEGKATSIWKKLTFKRHCWLIKSPDSCVGNSG